MAVNRKTLFSIIDEAINEVFGDNFDKDNISVLRFNERTYDLSVYTPSYGWREFNRPNFVKKESIKQDIISILINEYAPIVEVEIIWP